MESFDLRVSHILSRESIESTLGQWAATQKARVNPQGRLARTYKTKGNSMHWHITGLETGMGTVEVTYLPDEGKMRVSVHDNRRGYWAGKTCHHLAMTFGEYYTEKRS